MLIIKSLSTDPYFNIAAEEYLLKDFSDDIFMLYRNDPSIIVGKHQNTMEEINIDFVNRNNIKVVRRLSGGGTVYHDLGNLNFTFILNGIDKKLIDFKRYSQPIVDALNGLGLDAKFEGRNDIRINGKKVSGNAEHIFKKRVLHHGTLLFESNLHNLNEAIRIIPGSYQSNSVKSVRSNVANISEYLPKSITIDDFSKILIEFIVRTYKDVTDYQFNDQDHQKIKLLIENRYSKWEWNYGYSPTYTVSKPIQVNDSTYVFETKVENGVIVKINFTNDLIQLGDSSFVSQLIGLNHNPKVLAEKLNQFDFGEYLPGLSLEKFISGLF